jgi:hypothetical protein
MTTVVKSARATNAGIASSRLKVDMSNTLYKLEDDEGALFVTANMLGKEKAGGYEVQWHGSELRPKFVTITASASAASATLDITESEALQVNDIVIVPSTQETILVTSRVNATSYGATRSWGTTAAANIPAAEQVLIIHAHYDEGAVLQDARSVTETLYKNNVALWRDNLKITGTLQAIGEQGGLFYGNDVDLQRRDMSLVHKRGINSACLFSEYGSSGTRRSISGAVEFIEDNGSSRTDSTSALTFAAFMTLSQTMTRYNGKKMAGIISRQFATIVSQWALATSVTIQVVNGAKMFGLAVMDVTTPHGQFRLLVDDALEGATFKKFGLFLSTDKKGGPKWRYLRDTRLLKNRQEDDEDAYEEEILTEGSIEWGNANFHYLFKNAQTSA